MCAAQAAPPGPPPPPGAEARVADTAPQPGGHLHKGRAAGPARGPRGPSLRQSRCRPMRLGSARYPPVRRRRKKGRNEGGRAGGGRRCRHLRRLLLSAPLPPAQPSPRSRYVPVPVPVASPSRSGDNGTARHGSGPRARAPTSLAHPPRGGRDGMGGNGPSSREIRSEPPREFSNARDTAPGAGGGGLWTTDPGVPRGGRFRFRPRPGGCSLSWGTPGAVVPGPAGPAPRRARPWGRLCSPAPLSWFG
ncbi:unnamed protein product [Coccothraustes coccothraustes]